MTRRSRRPSAAGRDDLKAMRGRLAEISDGLSAVFQVVAQTFSAAGRAARNGEARSRPKTQSRVLVRSLDDAVAAPLGIEHCERGGLLVVYVDLGAVAPSAIAIHATPAGLRLTTGPWSYLITASRAYDPAPIKRAQRNGRLTLHFSAILDRDTDTK